MHIFLCTISIFCRKKSIRLGAQANSWETRTSTALCRWLRKEFYGLVMLSVQPSIEKKFTIWLTMKRVTSSLLLPRLIYQQRNLSRYVVFRSRASCWWRNKLLVWFVPFFIYRPILGIIHKSLMTWDIFFFANREVAIWKSLPDHVYSFVSLAMFT